MAKKKKKKSFERGSMRIEQGSGKTKLANLPSQNYLSDQKVKKKAKKVKKSKSKIGFDRSKMSPEELAKDTEKARKKMPVGVKSGETVKDAKTRVKKQDNRVSDLSRGYSLPKSLKKRRDM